MGLSVIVLAGGTGSRMGSKTPKVLHELAGKPLLDHVIRSITALQADDIYVVYGHMGEHVRAAMDHHAHVRWVEQKERLGTGHAVMQVLPHLNPEHQVLILYGDVPLIQTETLDHFVDSTNLDQVGLLTAIVANPKGLGRIVRDEYRQVIGIVEEKDASELERQIKEINTGIYCVPAKLLQMWLPQLKADNAQAEYYLTDIIKFARRDHISINVSKPRQVVEIFGANNRVELAQLERIYQKWQVEKLMLSGTSVADPERVDIRGEVTGGQDNFVDVCVVFEGTVELGDDCYIGPNCVLRNVKLGNGVVIQANSVIEGAEVHDNAEIGPFARIRPQTVIAKKAKVGNFVEIKKATLGSASKVNHLSYVGDAEIGEQVNIGAGVITCNYDGASKHKTIIGDNVFVGSDCQLVAPVEIGEGATIGAGSTITKDAPAGQLTLSRNQQKTIAGWTRPKKETAAES